MTEMSEENAITPVFTSVPEAPRADSDTQLLEIWLHGRSKHTQRAYRADMEHFLAWCVCQLDLAPFDALIWPHLILVSFARAVSEGDTFNPG
jgi:hypothetical protein